MLGNFTAVFSGVPYESLDSELICIFLKTVFKSKRFSDTGII